MNSDIEGTVATVPDAHGTIISMTLRFPFDCRLSGNRLVVVASLLLLCARPCPYALAETPVDRMDQIVRSYSDNHQFVGSVLVARGQTPKRSSPPQSDFDAYVPLALLLLRS
jgi:hypothetical protein